MSVGLKTIGGLVVLLRQLCFTSSAVTHLRATFTAKNSVSRHTFFLDFSFIYSTIVLSLNRVCRTMGRFVDSD